MKSFLLFFLLFSSQVNAGWHDRKCEGWAYFEERPVFEEKEEPIDQSVGERSPSETLSLLKKEMEDSFAKAVLEPTEENILHYLEKQHFWLKRSGQVARVWSKVVLENPELNNTLSGMPVSSYGTKFYHKAKSEEQKNLIKNLSQTHSILCFYQGEDPASKELAKVLKLFSNRHHWFVKGVSVDGIMIDEIQDSIFNSGLSEQLEVSHFPSIFVFDPTDGVAKPVGFGLVSVDMLETNIYLQFGKSME